MKNSACYLPLLIYCMILFSCIPKRNTVEKPPEDSPKDLATPSPAHFRGPEMTLDHPRITKLYRPELKEEHWPFFMYKDETFMVVGNINGDTTLDFYGDLIERYGGDGTGYDWTALLQHMLQKENACLLPHLSFDPEASAFYVFADSEKSQRDFAQFASAAFRDTAHIIKYLQLRGGLEMMEQ